jgi:hypothetical protein
MRIFRVICIVIVIVFLCIEGAVAQIPLKGSDFPALAGLHWGMPMQEVYEFLSSKGKVDKLTPTVLSYEDALLDVKMEVNFVFIENNSLLKLSSIEARLNDPDENTLKKIEKYFINRYGDKYNYKKDEGWKDNIDTEIKLWHINNENIEFKVLTYKQKRIVGLRIKYKSINSKGHKPIIPMSVKGSDFPSLAGLQWGMTMQSTCQYLKLKREIIHSSSSKLYYEDSVLNTKVGITLKYDYSDSLLILYTIEAEIIEPNRRLLQTVTNNMINHYGNKYDTKKESKSKFLYTINFEAKTWQLENESIGLMTMSHGDDVKSINLMYRYVDSKR